MGKYLMGIDVGTTGTKAMILDKKGKIYGTGYGEYPCQYPNPNWVEQDVDLLVNETYKACNQAVKSSGLDPKEIEAVGFSCQRATFVLVDEKNEPIENIFYGWQDNRGAEILEEAMKIVDPDTFFKTTGMPMTPTFTYAKLLWIMKNQPERYLKTKVVALMPEYIQYCFGADDFYCEMTNACTSGYLDPQKMDWADDVINSFGIDKNKLPQLVKPGTVVGKVTPKVSEKCGLAEGTLLIAGSGDQQCAAIGAGVIEDGFASLTLGTAGLLVVGTENLVLEDVPGVMATSSAALGLFNLEGIQLGAASSYRWMRDELADVEVALGKKVGVDAFELMDYHIQKSPVGSKGIVFMPYLTGAGYPYWNPDAKGVFAGLTFAHTKSDMVRSVMEGITLESKDMYETMKKSGVVLKQLAITGGATKSASWRQIIADMFGVPIRKLEVADATIVGAAVIAGFGAGWFIDVSDGVNQMVRYTETIDPIPENVETYNKRYEIYKNMVTALTESGVYSQFANL
ncbi:MAG: FGGY-family carbohydrate kinase [Eubacteriaceae bacterium]